MCVCVCVCQSQNAAFGAQSVMHTKSKLSNSTDYAMISIRISLSRSLARAVSLSRARTLSFARALSRARSLVRALSRARALSLSSKVYTAHARVSPWRAGLPCSRRARNARLLAPNDQSTPRSSTAHPQMALISAQPLMLAEPFLFSKSGVLNKKRSLAPLPFTSGVN